jgi:S-adenosylmethionine:tRNA-ribosyltransferase-isomerase (queuine synthetase)
VPYNGGAPAAAAVAAGDVHFGVMAAPGALPHIKSGRGKVIGITTAKKSPLDPSWATPRDAGIPDLDASIWVGLFAPKGTPQPVVEPLNKEVRETLKSADVQKRFIESAGGEAVGMTQQEFLARIKADAERYQTVYASERGSVAAPTAGLHFTTGVLEAIRTRGIGIANIVLHVGAGTFKPVEVEDPAQHVMHEEPYEVPDRTAVLLNETRARGKAVIAVGSTAARTLESCVASDGRFSATNGETRIFIRPPYRWKTVDKLLTNFHLPRSTLLMLVAAFAGYELTMTAYAEAVRQQYRFFSYGDAMLIV